MGLLQRPHPAHALVMRGFSTIPLSQAAAQSGERTLFVTVDAKAGRRWANRAGQHVGHQHVCTGMRAVAVGFESQTGGVGHLGHEILRVIPDGKSTQCHDLHECVGGLFDGTLVFLAGLWRHVYLLGWI